MIYECVIKPTGPDGSPRGHLALNAARNAFCAELGVFSRKSRIPVIFHRAVGQGANAILVQFAPDFVGSVKQLPAAQGMKIKEFEGQVTESSSHEYLYGRHAPGV